MGNPNTTNRDEGRAEQIGGTLKEGAGKLIGDRQMEAEGAAKRERGEAREKAGKAGERTAGAVQEAVGTVKNRVAHVLGADGAATEGKEDELEGQRRRDENRD
jgi:uncharacterized protein YjbJ (UPF0337 family)